MSFSNSEAPTVPYNKRPLMTVPQIREALAAFPVDQHALLVAMVRGAWDDGFGAGAGRLPRVNPFDHFGSEPPPPEPQKRKRR